MNSSWHKKTEVVKGDFAENIIDDFLEDEKGFIIYVPKESKEKKSRPHPFDRFAAGYTSKEKKEKRVVIIIEIKAKACLNLYPATGIDMRHYKRYKEESERMKIPLYLFFVDEMLGAIYGNYLHNLEKKFVDYNGIEYPNTQILQQHNIILFPLNNMNFVKLLSQEQIDYLKEKSGKRNHDYLTPDWISNLKWVSKLNLKEKEKETDVTDPMA